MRKKNVCIYICLILLIPLVSTTAMANEPPSIPHIIGPTTGKINVKQTYGICSEDQDGDKITYTVDWGDGTVDTFGPVSSGLCATLDYAWSEEGTYTIKAKASDGQAESDWGELEVTIPRAKFFPNLCNTQLFERFSLIIKLIQNILR